MLGLQISLLLLSIASVESIVYGLVAPDSQNLTIAPLDLKGDWVKMTTPGVTTRGIHILDRMSSGASMAVDAASAIAFIVGYTSNIPGQTNMSLFGISLQSGNVMVNVTLPLPYWDNGDDHHTTVHLLRSGELVVVGIEKGEGLRCGVAVVSQFGQVKRYHSLSSLAFGEYCKGPSALDVEDHNLYLAIATLSGDDWVLKIDLDSGAPVHIASPWVVLSLAFDTSRHGFWALVSNATEILSDGYYIAFFDSTSSKFSSVRALGRAQCSSVSNPGDNWNLAAAFDSTHGYFVTREICQPDGADINERVAVIDVAHGSVMHRPLCSSMNNSGLGLFGLAVPSTFGPSLVV